MPTLYISDLDGTLLNAESRVSARSVELLNESIAAGVLFSIATARTPATVSLLLKDVDCRIPVIVMTGAAIWDMGSRRYIHASFHNEDTARQLVATYRRRGLSAFVYTLGHDDVVHIYHIGGLSDLEREFIAERSGSPFKAFHIPEDGVSSIPDSCFDRVLLFYTMCPTAEVRPVYDEIRGMENLRANFYHDIYGEDTAILEVFGPGASKADAVRILARQVGAERITAYGDNINDLPILHIADDAVAVENAVPEVKAAASRVIGPNTSDAVALDIRRESESCRVEKRAGL